MKKNQKKRDEGEEKNEDRRGMKERRKKKKEDEGEKKNEDRRE